MWDHHHETGDISISLETDPRECTEGPDAPVWRILSDDGVSTDYPRDILINYSELVGLCEILPKMRDSWERFSQEAGLPTSPPLNQIKAYFGDEDEDDGDGDIDLLVDSGESLEKTTHEAEEETSTEDTDLPTLLIEAADILEGSVAQLPNSIQEDDEYLISGALLIEIVTAQERLDFALSQMHTA